MGPEMTLLDGCQSMNFWANVKSDGIQLLSKVGQAEPFGVNWVKLWKSEMIASEPKILKLEYDLSWILLFHFGDSWKIECIYN